MDSPPDDGPCEVTITAPDHNWLLEFVRQLVVDRLAAAAHVDKMSTTYRWRDVVNNAEEARAVVHTTFRQVGPISERVKQRHPYEVACVVACPILGGSNSYLAWLRENS